MQNLNNTIIDAIRDNARIFLNKAIIELTSHDDAKDDPLPKDVATISVALIQTSFELLLVAYSIKRRGLRSILQKKDLQKTDEEIATLFESHELRTLSFADLKDQLHAKFNLFSQDQISQINTFQRIRNKLLHFSYDLTADDRYDFKSDIIDYLIHTILPLFPRREYEWTESIALEARLDARAFNKLVSFPPYIAKMQVLARQVSENVYKCFYCENKTFAAEDLICYACNHEFDARQFTNCERCHSENSLLFDHLNIVLNGNYTKGLCMNCDDDDIVYKCPICHEAYGIENVLEEDRCSEGRCLYS